MRRELWIIPGLLMVLACGGMMGETEPEPEPEPEPVAEGGTIHVDYPAAATTGVEGQFVLVPSRDFLDKALEKGDGSGTFIYYGANITSVGATESGVKSLAGTESTMPNTLIIPITAGYDAQVGDILLARWTQGSGMQRAIVTKGGTEPTVRYLDLDPTGLGKDAKPLKADQFHAITGAWQIGTTVACTDSGDRRSRWTLVHDGGDNILVLGFAGKLAARPRSECVGLLPTQDYKVAETVWVPVIGSYKEGKVTRVDKAGGRVHVQYEWGGKKETKAFGIVDVTYDFTDNAPGVAAKAGKGKKGKGKKGGKAGKGKKGKGKKGKGKKGKGKKKG